jgi:hypothetical protein
MGILVIGGALGMILGRFFKWPVLIPAYGLVSVMVVANPAHMENSLAGWCVQTVVVITSLQIGYVAGVVARNVRLQKEDGKIMPRRMNGRPR